MQRYFQGPIVDTAMAFVLRRSSPHPGEREVRELEKWRLCWEAGVRSVFAEV